MAIVTIGGNIGAGKTVLAARLAAMLGYEELYVGGIFRKVAQERGVPIDEFYASLKNDAGLERKIDERQSDMMKEKQNLVIQGRVTWYLAKQNAVPAINILLMVDPRVGAERKMKQGIYAGKNIEEVIILQQKREQDERDHYRSLYGIEDHLDPKHYDIILDTSPLDENEVFEKIFTEVKKYETKK
jgi:cytidylate kinase